MHIAITKAFRGSAVISAALLIQLAGCSRVDIAEPSSQPPRTEFSTPKPVGQSPTERIAEIERELAAPSTGTAKERDRRATLRGELANLQATYGWQDRSAASLQYGHQLQQLNQQQMQQQQLQLQYGGRTPVGTTAPSSR